MLLQRCGILKWFYVTNIGGCINWFWGQITMSCDKMKGSLIQGCLFFPFFFSFVTICEPQGRKNIKVYTKTWFVYQTAQIRFISSLSEGNKWKSACDFEGEKIWTKNKLLMVLFISPQMLWIWTLAN